jgi:hypothetical protein
MASQPEKELCMLDFHLAKSVISGQSEFRKKLSKDLPAAISIRKYYKNLWAHVASVMGSSDQPITSAQTIDCARQAYLQNPNKSTRWVAAR